MIYPLVFIIGSVVGSFLNVCIHRLPKNEEIVFRRSHCPHCNGAIRWYDNIPLISYILLRAKCRHCGKKIRIRYFVVELLTALLFCMVWYITGCVHPVSAVIYCIFVSLLIIGSFIDLELLIIPDVINFSGICLGLVASAVYPALMKTDIWYIGLFRSFLGVVIGGGSLYLIAVTASAVLKKEAMGMGDVKLLAMIGSFLGWPWTFLTIFISSFLGALAGITLIISKKTSLKGKIPFGPYLALGAVTSMLWGPKLVNWYLKLL